MSVVTRLGILGGTFDPIHLGHLDVAAAARAALELNEVVIIPSRVPPHRPQAPGVSGYHRFAMVGLAVAGQEHCRASDLELESDGPSYTSVTLRKLAQGGAAPSQLFFITGADAFAEIATWHEFPEVLDLSHFVVVSRAGHRAADLVRTLPDIAPRMRDPADRVDPVPSTSGTFIWLVNTKTRDISSSDIRNRLAQGHSVDSLVSPLVAAHIARHRLYSAPGKHVA